LHGFSISQYCAEFGIHSEDGFHELELKSVVEQVENLRKNLKGISEDDRATIEAHESFAILEQLINTWSSEISASSESISTIITEFQKLPTPIPTPITFPGNSEESIKGIASCITLLFDEVRKQLTKMQNKLVEFGDKEPAFTENIVKWQQILTNHKQLYESAKERSSSQQVTLTQITQLEERGKGVRKSIADKKQLLNKLGDQEQSFAILKEKWISTHKERADIINSQCKKLSGLSDNNLRATLGRGKGLESVINILRSILAGSNIRKEKLDSICSLISSSQNPINEWHELLIEFELLAQFDAGNISTENFPPTPKLSSIGFTQNDLKKLAEKITVENFIDIYLVKLDDLPVFEYRTREGEYIDFSDASAGQQATSLIHVLLNQDGPTLIIDQPEDDLDNQMVSEIAELICKSKKNRQLIFTSHNANIVVNGDAELVACCDYCVSGDQSNGEIKQIGAIDINLIRDEITKIMEGGEKAFKLRKDKYGF
jgi:type III restriction enzyme